VKKFKMTTGRQSALDKVLSFEEITFDPCIEAVEWYFCYTERGEKPEYSLAPWYADYARILMAHHLMSGAQREMWLEGHRSGDYPLPLLCLDYLSEDVHPRKRYVVQLALDLCVSETRITESQLREQVEYEKRNIPQG
jgi:hypothetical protein